MSRQVLILLLIVSAIAVPFSFPQSQEIPPWEGPYEEKVDVELVDLYLTALDKKGHFITNLRADELTVKENGIIQTIQSFGNFAGVQNEIPLNLAFIIDSSASMDDDIEDTKKLDLSKSAGLMLMDQLQPLDRMMVVRFDETPYITPLTTDRAVIGDAIEKTRVHFRHTALFDTLAQTLDALNEVSGRKLLVLCSDGLDNISKTKFETVLKRAVNSPDLTIVVLGMIGYQDPRFLFFGPNKTPHQGKQVLQKFADGTGGYAYFPGSIKEMNKVQELIRSFVHSQYSLAYKSTNMAQDGSWRDIEITCKRKGIKLRHRNGYFAR
jgi:VWFA-related protein